MDNQPQVATVVFTIQYTVEMPYKDIPDLEKKLEEFDVDLETPGPDPDTYIINAVKDSNGEPIPVEYLDNRPDSLAQLILETNESLSA